ncbi:Rrf2 family transcriptional regulator [Listeria grayi]|uniref:Transcriptional regulator, Rrf2 family n=1 Tax=Listeria grayi DSM 20601 TaxID=525367 RepID=D7UWK3_LISGR|nr:Rrf2 family transcriptional regulator [Listeria grayi]EFI84061.1 transcriptional regulator, Rrf2 family [Listeria grayi DSM 20601]MBC1921623.1 Rrf2 family transcriptional regulator [Listeria grayi]
MKYSHKLSDGIHILAYMCICKDSDLSSKAIAASIESNPSLVRRMMAQLVKAGLIESRPGAVAPVLTKPAEEISLLEIYQAIEQDHRILHVDKNTNPRCIVGGNIQHTLNGIYDQLQANVEQEMREVTLQTVVDDIMVQHLQKKDNV